MQPINHARMLAAKEKSLVYGRNPLHLINSSYMWEQVLKVSIQGESIKKATIIIESKFLLSLPNKLSPLSCQILRRNAYPDIKTSTLSSVAVYIIPQLFSRLQSHNYSIQLSKKKKKKQPMPIIGNRLTGLPLSNFKKEGTFSFLNCRLIHRPVPRTFQLKQSKQRSFQILTEGLLSNGK